MRARLVAALTVLLAASPALALSPQGALPVPPEEPPPHKIEFRMDSARLSRRHRPVLDAIVCVMRLRPGLKLRVSGHADASGAYGYNVDLSGRRAESVKRYMVEHGVAPERIEIVAFGPDTPIADNGSRDGRARNRRVEMRFDHPANGSTTGGVSASR